MMAGQRSRSPNPIPKTALTASMTKMTFMTIRARSPVHGIAKSVSSVG
jgi:hypothetical protein